jgi:cyclase
MLTTRVIPCLLLHNGSLVKPLQFGSPTYVGDPTNAIKIFNEKQVDEILVLDITATIERRRPPFAVIEKFAGECFMPAAYGGGLTTIEDVTEVFRLGIEKVVINAGAIESPGFIRQLADRFGSQAIVVSIDARRNINGQYEVFIHRGKKSIGMDPSSFAIQMTQEGAGEILINSIDQDGTMRGYDLDLIRRVTSVVSVPVIACGGAGKLIDFRYAVIDGGATAVAAGSMVVHFGRNRAVLINFPNRSDIDKLFE